MIGPWRDPQERSVDVPGIPGSRVQTARPAIAPGRRVHLDDDARRRRLRELMDSIDDVLNDLEQLHLVNRRRVPSSYEPRLARLSAILPVDVREELRTGIPIKLLMECLYEVQEKLMARKSAIGATRAEPPDGRSPGDRSLWGAAIWRL